MLEKTPLGLLRSIVHQILLTDNAMYKHFRPFYLTASVNKEWQWRQSELQEFIRWALTQQHLSKPFLLFIDALDECNESDVRDVVKFLELLSTYASRANVLLKICLSSRHYPSITMYRVVELTVENSGDHKGDISRYIDDTLRVSDADIKSEIRRKADGIFLWVVIAVSLLNKAYDEGQVEAMRTTLEEVPADLEKMFSAILRKDMSNPAETVRMLQWVLFSLRPLTPQELFAAVVGIALPTDDLIRRRITNSSKGLIEIRKGNADSVQSIDTLEGLTDAQEENTDSVQFIHLSVRDFLFRYKRLQILDANLGSEPFATIHGRLWARCWSSIQEAVTTSTCEEQINERYDKDPFLKYAASHILEHAEKALSNDATMNKAADCGSAQERPSGATRKTSIQNWLRESDLWFPRLELDERQMGTSLVYALAVLKLPNLVRALPEGTNVNKWGGWYGNALQAASQGGDLEIVEQLLQKGAYVNAKGGLHGGALPAALFSGRLEIARLLLQHGADASAQGCFISKAA
ncbi:hypothetical protein LZ31DRAFT_543884 [Colletotrichum somersetense]|nr:hypothetical protein LZ31DRAFT_543884 [Colletotrichum somersetense]